MHYLIDNNTQELIECKERFDKFIESFNYEKRIEEGLRLLYFVFDNEALVDLFSDIDPQGYEILSDDYFTLQKSDCDINEISPERYNKAYSDSWQSWCAEKIISFREGHYYDNLDEDKVEFWYKCRDPFFEFRCPEFLIDKLLAGLCDAIANKDEDINETLDELFSMRTIDAQLQVAVFRRLAKQIDKSTSDDKESLENTIEELKDTISVLEDKVDTLVDKFLFSAPERDGLRYDPVEDTPEYKAVIDRVTEQAEKEILDELHMEPPFMGYCHCLWPRQKRILKEEYHIAWFSPDEMNPTVLFD